MCVCRGSPLTHELLWLQRVRPLLCGSVEEVSPLHQAEGLGARHRVSTNADQAAGCTCVCVHRLVSEACLCLSDT